MAFKDMQYLASHGKGLQAHQCQSSWLNSVQAHWLPFGFLSFKLLCNGGAFVRAVTSSQTAFILAVEITDSSSPFEPQLKYHILRGSLPFFM